ncbi:GntR family transcriptional regulator [Thalassobacter stenotrophicus]|uniref:GntR family transcriptional regulator n=1 Tax=Thalassobacter stenotrophicus TaxID=266809 RepID=UPI0022A9A7FE|nr:GntR family transcriptional regulator [Thalassobacter stenotrophicus]UYP69316.1 GntR family transcriptional regulator [Thalassobacter stenotrophicus]
MALSTNTIGQGRATLAGEVRGEIERLIVEGELAAGVKLNELSLSNAMGVSRGTVREAIRSLADSGLIDLIANRGAFVHETTLDEIRNLYDLRGAIFAMACSACARRMADGDTPHLARKLETNLERMQKANDSNDPKAYYPLNIEFHDLILENAGNPRAKAMYDNMIKEMHLFRRRGLSNATNIARSLEEHRAISDAIIAGDTDAARRAGEQHTTSGFTRYLSQADKADTSAAD